jgi:arylsulfatase A-like enzyme
MAPKGSLAVQSSISGFLSGLQLLAILTICILVLPATSSIAKPSQRPNILFILSDDQRWDTIHALGNDEIRTPNLDHLVEQGFNFSNVYCMGSMSPAVCLPSRTMLLTGRSVWRLPHVTGLKAPPDLPLLPRVLHDAGYVTYHCGKSNNACRYGNAAFDFNVETVKSGPDDMRQHGDQIVQFLQKHDHTKPFFIYLAPPVPHDPRIAPPKFVQMYDPNKLSLSKNFMPEHPFDNGELKIRDEMLAPHPRTKKEMRQHLADYYACISDLDDQVGRVLASLRELGYADNTVVIFSSDQGLAVGGRHGLMGKQNLYEHVKPPLVIAGTNIPHGQSDALVYLYDLFPTICDYAQAPIPAVAEGKSLAPIVRGEATDVRPYLFAAYRDWQRMVRDKRWKLIEYVVGDQHHTQLFDLSTDPDELNNLAAKESSAGVLARLRKQLLHLARNFGDPDGAIFRDAFAGKKTHTAP